MPVKRKIIIDEDEYVVEPVVGDLLLTLSYERDYYRRKLADHHIEIERQ